MCSSDLKENARHFLKEHPETAAAIETAIRQNSGLVAGSMMTDTEKAADD